jgi:hypothetical protein
MPPQNTNTTMGAERGDARSQDFGLPPAALARHADDERRRELARALHEPPRPRARRISEQLEVIRAQLERYRERAMALHAKLLDLETSGNDNLASLRKTLIESSVRLEGGARSLIETPPHELKKPA